MRPQAQSSTLVSPYEVLEPSIDVRKSQELWLAVYLPFLSTEIIAKSLPKHNGAIATIEPSKRGHIIYQACYRAKRYGIRPGMTLSEANTLCFGLDVYSHDSSQEYRRLEYLADLMTQFSPKVCIKHPNMILLEIRSSLGLFKGYEELKKRIEQQLRKTQHDFQIAVSPTTKSAELLALSGKASFVEEEKDIRSSLGHISIGLLNIEAKLFKRLSNTGIRTLRDIWRLPRDGLGRRYGKSLVRYLDQIQGNHPDPQLTYCPAFKYSRWLFLDYATDDLQQIQEALDYLLQLFIAYLVKVDRGTNRMKIKFSSERDKRCAQIDIEVRDITRDKGYLKKVAVEKLNQMKFNCAISALRLSSQCIYPYESKSNDLFVTWKQNCSELSWQQSEEVIAARLSGESLNKIYVVDEYRPEYAWSNQPDRILSDQQSLKPLWLLAEPKLLSTQNNRIWFKGPTTVLRGPERIEAGWWDNKDLRRDYYVMSNPKGSKLWVYQDLKDRQWYLHGLFG